MSRQPWRRKAQDARPKRTPAHPKSAVPFKVITMMIYGRYSWLTRLGDHKYNCSKSEMAAELKVPAYRMVQYLEYLVEWGLVTKMRIYKHTISLELAAPVTDVEDKW